MGFPLFLSLQACFNLFPVGVPTCYIGESVKWVGLDRHKGFYCRQTGKKLMGMVQATVVAPPSLFLPILPTTSNGKLKFGLCGTCVREEMQGFCKHSDKEREIQDIWTTEELHFAVAECQYEIKALHELVLYDEAKPIFKEYYTKMATM